MPEESMAIRSRNPNVVSVGNNPQRTVHKSRIPTDATNPLQDSGMEGDLTVLRVTNFWQNSAIECPQDVAPNVPGVKIEDEFDMSEDEYIQLLRQCTQLLKTCST